MKKLIRKILEREGARGKVTVVLMDDARIRDLNRRFRGKDKATDVLAFPMGEEGEIGDIAISTETARRNAKKFGVSYPAEMKRLLVHGVLHLLGYDHGKEMRDAEKIYQKL